MSMRLNFAAATLSLAVTTVSFGASVVVDSTAILNPNPSNLGITETGNTSLTAARALIAANRAASRSGVVDFQQQAQGGTFPNSTAPDNGIDFANGATQPLLVTAGSVAGAGGLVATGPTIFSFYRLESTGTFDGVTTTNGVNNFDSNLNQGGNVISGGFSTRYPGAVSATNPLGDGTAVNGINAAYSPNILTSISGGYIGINNQASPATMVFNTPLAFFGITALPRGQTRDTLITLTEVPVDVNGVPVVGGTPITVLIGGGATVVGANAVFYGQTADAGYAITQAALSNPNGQGQNRYDDLAFVVSAVPEPTSLAVLGLGAAAMLRRRRA